MDESLKKWIEDNKLTASNYTNNSGLDVVKVEEFGELLYIHTFDGNIIDEDFGFILSDEEFDALDKAEFQ